MDEKELSISDSEWEVMKVLWEQPNMTLRQIDNYLHHKKWSYTTVRTLVTRLVEKGAIGADKSMISNFKYYPIVSESDCKNKEVKSLLERVFDGSAKMMVSSLTKDSNLTKKEQQELMDLIEKMDEGDNRI